MTPPPPPSADRPHTFGTFRFAWALLLPSDRRDAHASAASRRINRPLFHGHRRLLRHPANLWRLLGQFRLWLVCELHRMHVKNK